VEEIESIPVSTKSGSSLGKKRALGGGIRGPKIGEEKIVPGGKRRKTTTIAHEEDMEKKKSMKVSWIPELMEKWRCKNENCKQYRDGSCLVLQDGCGCRPQNAYVLGAWDTTIKKGEAVVCAFPSSVRPPPPTKEKSGNSQAKGHSLAASGPWPNPTSPAPMQISVSTPAPSIPWWLGSIPPPNITPPAYHHPASYPTSTPPEASHILPTVQDIRLYYPSQTASQYPPSSPVRSHGLSAPELLARFIAWFEKTYVRGGISESTNVDSEDVEELLRQIANAHRALKKELYDLEGIRKMDGDGWKELIILVGLGKRMTRAIREFEKVQF